MSGAIYEGGLYHSNYFKLQVEELLKDVSFRNEKTSKAIRRDLEDLKAVIEQAPNRPPQSVCICLVTNKS